MLGSDKSRLLGACALAGLLTLAPFARAADKTALPGSVAPWVATSKKVGAADASRHVTIAVHLALRDIDTLKAVVDKVSNPHSASYGHYLTPAAFRARFAPAAADVQAVVDLLTKAGMDAIKVGPAGAYVMADATVAQLESTFGVSQDVYQFRGLKLRANAEAPSVPAELAGKIVAIEGLDDSDYLRKPMHRSVVEGEHLPPAGFKPDATTITPPPVAANNPSPYCDTYFGDSKATLSTKPGPYPAKLPWLMCGYDPKQIGEAYGLNKVKLDGSGVSVAIIDAFASPTLQADGNAYAKNHKLPKLTAANFTQIIPKGIYGVDPNDSCGP